MGCGASHAARDADEYKDMLVREFPTCEEKIIECRKKIKDAADWAEWERLESLFYEIKHHMKVRDDYKIYKARGWV